MSMSIKFTDDPVGYVTYWIHWLMATFGMGWKAAWDFWRRVDPKTGMTPAQTVAYLEEQQDPREQEAQAKSEIAAEASYASAKKKSEAQKEAEVIHTQVVKEQQEEFKQLPEAEQKKVWTAQDDIEQRNQFKATEAAAYRQNLAVAEATSTVAAPAPTITQPVVTVKPAPDCSAWDQYEARRQA